MNLEHVQIERMDSYSTSNDKFVEDFHDMHTHDILRYARSRNLQYLEWADMVSLVHELADRLEEAHAMHMDKTDW